MILKIGLIVVCGWVLDRGWIGMQPERITAKALWKRHRFLLIGAVVGIVFLVSDIHYTHLYVG